MDASYYDNARKWYNAIYVKVASERVIYFVILLISIICFYYTIRIAVSIYDDNIRRNTYIAMTNHRKKDNVTMVSRVPNYFGNKSLNLLRLMIEKYVENIETLQYSSDETGSSAIKNKMIVIKNLSGKEVYDNYVNSSYSSEYGDTSLAILKLRKIATVERIDFIYDDLNVVEKIYSKFSRQVIPRGAKVYFSSEITNETSKKKNFVATLFFKFRTESQRKVNSTIEFKVTDYSVEEISKDAKGDNE